MENKAWNPRTVVIVGAGDVGSTCAYTLAQSGLADEIALLDVNEELAKGQVLDLAHGKFFFPSLEIHVADKTDYADAKIIVITAGSKQKPGESRIDLLKRNAAIMKNIVFDIVAQESQAVLVVVSNPVDVLTYVAQKHSGWPRSRVLGSGTVLDSARFRYLLSQHCNIDVHNVHAYILGEHGDTEFAAWSMVHLAGMAIDDYCPVCGRCTQWDEERSKMEESVRNSAYHIIDYKGATYYAVGLALVRIVGAILRDTHSVLTVSTLLQGEYGLEDVCLSVPCIVAQEGITRIAAATLLPDEQKALENSASVLKEAIASLEAGS
ncbi:MAG: L-lactate dehydrogenase [Anaerolineae bacterium]